MLTSTLCDCADQGYDVVITGRLEADADYVLCADSLTIDPAGDIDIGGSVPLFAPIIEIDLTGDYYSDGHIDLRGDWSGGELILSANSVTHTESMMASCRSPACPSFPKAGSRRCPARWGCRRRCSISGS